MVLGKINKIGLFFKSKLSTIKLVNELNTLVNSKIWKAIENIELLESLEISHELFINRTAETNLKNQPGIYKFITESIFEELREISDISDDEEGWIFLVLKSTIDALNKKVN